LTTAVMEKKKGCGRGCYRAWNWPWTLTVEEGYGSADEDETDAERRKVAKG